MDITPYVERLREQLGQAAAAGDEQIRDAADRLSLALDPSIRLTLMEALSQATAEITSEMRAGAVEVRLNGRDLEFVVDDERGTESATGIQHGLQAGFHPGGESAESPEDDESETATARITLRLPEGIKTRAEELAARHGSSLNTWIVTVLRAATRESAINIDIDLSSIGIGDFPGSTGRRGPKRITGWV